jgi:hypothetical protein
MQFLERQLQTRIYTHLQFKNFHSEADRLVTYISVPDTFTETFLVALSSSRQIVAQNILHWPLSLYNSIVQCYLQKVTVYQLVTNLRILMNVLSLKCTEQPITCLYPEPDESNPCSHRLSLLRFNLI